MLAIIGGSGLTRLSTLAVAHREVVRTPYGEPSSALIFGQVVGRDVVFLARHGHGHSIPPHRVNYRANLWALKHRNVDAILAVASVGAIASVHAPGDLVLPHHTPTVRSFGTAASPRRAPPAWPCTMAVSTELCPGRGSRPRPRSTAWSATARPSSA